MRSLNMRPRLSDTFRTVPAWSLASKALIWLLLAGGLFAEAPNPAIDALFTPLIDGESPGAAVLVRKNGHTFFERGYGVTNLNTPKHIDARTNFRLASFTKQFTAMAV